MSLAGIEKNLGSRRLDPDMFRKDGNVPEARQTVKLKAYFTATTPSPA